MSTPRVIWICWCLGWAGLWVLSGFHEYDTPSNMFACVASGTGCTQPGPLVLGIIASILSVAAIWLPVRKLADKRPHTTHDVKPPLTDK